LHLDKLRNYKLQLHYYASARSFSRKGKSQFLGLDVFVFTSSRGNFLRQFAVGRNPAHLLAKLARLL
jgi:hypothetical protein